MIKKTLWLVLIASLLVLTACQDQALAAMQTTPSPAETEVAPTEEAAQEPTAVSTQAPSEEAEQAETATEEEAAQPPAALSADDDTPCPMGVPTDETLGETLICGQIEVPENWDNPGERTLTISYAVLKSPALAPFNDPVIYFNGGPGESALTVFANSKGFLEKPRELRDVIIWDERGTTHSGQLYCPQDVRQEDQAAVDAIYEEYSDVPFVVGMDLDVMEEYWTRSYEALGFERCGAYFQEQGIDLTQYSTYNTVRDAIALMRHLGYPGYNFYGVSYGTNVALSIQDYYTTHPEFDLPALRSSIIDGVEPRNIAFLENGFVQAEVSLRLFADCEADEACGAAYPDIRQRFIDLLAALDEAPITTEDGTEVTLSDFVEVVRKANDDPGLRVLLPRVVDELESGQAAAYAVAQAATQGAIAMPQPPKPPRDESIQDIPASITTPVAEIGGTVFFSELQLQSLAAAAAQSVSLPQLFANTVSNYYSLLGSNGLMGSTVLPLLSSDPAEQTREQLGAFARRATQPETAKILQNIVDSLTDEQVAEIYSIMTSDAYVRPTTSIETMLNTAVTCNDHINDMDYEGAMEVYEAYEVPQLLEGLVAYVPQYGVRCEWFGITRDEVTPPPPAVQSDVPTLVINGEIDTSTPVEWGQLASEALTDATFIVLPGTPHVPGTQSDCGRALINAYFASPDGDINLSCIEDMIWPYILPDDELPELPEQTE